MQDWKNFKLTAGFRGLAIDHITQLDLTEPMRLSLTPWGKKRGLSANALSWAYYPLIGDYTGLLTEQAHCECKIEFGLPILFARIETVDCEYAKTVYNILSSIQFWSFTRENQWKVIKAIQITSVFNTKEMAKYIEDIQYFYGQQGLVLQSNKD